MVLIISRQISGLSKYVNDCSRDDHCKHNEESDSCVVVRHQASILVLLSGVSMIFSVITSADLSFLYEQPPALVTLAKAIRTMME